MTDYTPQILEFAKLKFGDSFLFRPYQIDAINEILNAYFENPNGYFLLDCPTGGGKSIIAIVFAGVLANLGKTGYILASDLSLHEQYANDFKKCNLYNWGIIKGVDNYECHANHQKFSIGECKIKGTNYSAAEKLPCFKKCGYLSARKKAIISPVALLTYPYALIQRNYVESQMNTRNAPFGKRDFVVCDESHKLLDIVQNHFSPIVSFEIVNKIEKLIYEVSGIGQAFHGIKPNKIKSKIEQIYATENQQSLLELLDELVNLIYPSISKSDNLREFAIAEFGEDHIPADWISVFGLIDWIKDIHCKLQDYCEIISKVGVHKLIKNPKEHNIVFNCIDDFYLLEKYLYSKFGFKLLMTATMGNPNDFAKSHGIASCKYFKMPSTFNFDKSPIIVYPGKKMSAKYIDYNITWAIDTISDIIRSHPDESGIIHSGSYELTNKIYKDLPSDIKKRIILYKGSSEKHIALKKMHKKTGLILMGPSILEGLNLIDEKSRFQIFLKIPYPHLGDKYVAAKLKYSQSWYNWQTCIFVMQGIGRSIRTPDDWAITYILDGCFADLLRANPDNFPIEFKNRLRIKYSTVG